MPRLETGLPAAVPPPALDAVALYELGGGLA
jgi:hypothetical protein